MEKTAKILISTAEPALAENIFKLFGEIHNHIYANEGLSPQAAFLELLNILFLKIEDEKRADEPSEFRVTEAERAEINGPQGALFYARLNKLLEAAKRSYAEVFERDDRVRLKPSTLAYVVDRLQGIKLSGSERDVVGIAFQKSVFSSQRGDRGQFFTPEPVIKLCVEFLAPTPGETVLDPACGSGGFLVETMKRVWREHFRWATDGVERRRLEKEYAATRLKGVEISRLVAKVSKMRMILEGDGYAGIVNADALSSWTVLNEAFSSVERASAIECRRRFDLILTNPPFGSQGRITDRDLLKDYRLARKWERIDGRLRPLPTLQTGQAPEILFIERCLDMLKDGGRLAMVLPNGHFENSKLEYVREFIRQRARILAIVSLPATTFLPHGTGVKASVLFAQKLDAKASEAAQREPARIFFATIKKIGYEGNKHGTIIYRRETDGTLRRDADGSAVVDEDVTGIIERYGRFRLTNEAIDEDAIFTIDETQLGNRFDVEFYRPAHRELRERLLKNGAKALGEVAEIVRRRSAKLKCPESVIRYIEISDINTAYGEIVSATRLSAHEAPSRASYDVHEGEIITAVAGNSIGTPAHATAIVSAEYEGAVCTNGFRVLRAREVDPCYLFMFLRSDVFLSQIYRFRTGAAIPAVADEDFRSILIPLPGEDVQREIAARVQESLELRRKSRLLLQDFKIEL
ncbi:MAG: N-6 DNA methylase [Pyrinomonadaceae bacterium]